MLLGMAIKYAGLRGKEVRVIVERIGKLSKQTQSSDRYCGNGNTKNAKRI
jgi:hypothetical protein